MVSLVRGGSDSVFPGTRLQQARVCDTARRKDAPSGRALALERLGGATARKSRYERPSVQAQSGRPGG
jgi:hypothetical protein